MALRTAKLAGLRTLSALMVLGLTSPLYAQRGIAGITDFSGEWIDNSFEGDDRGGPLRRVPVERTDSSPMRGSATTWAYPTTMPDSRKPQPSIFPSIPTRPGCSDPTLSSIRCVGSSPSGGCRRKSIH